MYVTDACPSMLVLLRARRLSLCAHPLLCLSRVAQVSYFLIGVNIKARPGIPNAELAAGHTISSHTMSHLSLLSLTLDQVGRSPSQPPLYAGLGSCLRERVRQLEVTMVRSRGSFPFPPPPPTRPHTHGKQPLHSIPPPLR
jgi:hypothetical protein